MRPCTAYGSRCHKTKLNQPLQYLSHLFLWKLSSSLVASHRGRAPGASDSRLRATSDRKCPLVGSPQRSTEGCRRTSRLKDASLPTFDNPPTQRIHCTSCRSSVHHNPSHLATMSDDTKSFTLQSEHSSVAVAWLRWLALVAVRAP